LSSLKVYLGGQLWGFVPTTCKNQNLVQTIVSQTTSYILSFKFLFWALEQFKNFNVEGPLWEAGVFPLEDPLLWSPKRPLNLVQTIVSQTTSYILSFKLLCWAVSKYHFGRPFWGQGLAPKDPNLVQTIVSQTTSYILSFSFLCWAVQKCYFGVMEWWFAPRRSPILVQTIVSQTTSFIMSFNVYVLQFNLKDP